MLVENLTSLSANSRLSQQQGPKTRVLLCSNDTEAMRLLEGVFSALASYNVTRCALEELGTNGRVEADSFDMTILDVGDGLVLDDPQFHRARASFGNIPIIFVSEMLDQDRIRQLIKLDGADWLPKPLRQRTIIDTVNAITQRQKSGANKVHAVVSCGGGAGGSSVAIMLAHYFSRKQKRTQPTAALFDLDFCKADIGAYLNIENEYRLEDVVGKSERVDLEFINVIKKMHDSGFSLFSFECPKVLYSDAGAELVLKMLDLVSFQHDHTVLDLSSYMTPWQADILAAVDTVTIVAGTSLPSLQRAKHTFKTIAAGRGTEKGLQIVVNRVRRSLFGSQFGKKDMSKLFDVSRLTVVPDEREMMLEALNRGLLPTEVNKRSVFCRRIEGLADTLAGRKIV